MWSQISPTSRAVRHTPKALPPGWRDRPSPNTSRNPVPPRPRTRQPPLHGVVGWSPQRASSCTSCRRSFSDSLAKVGLSAVVVTRRSRARRPAAVSAIAFMRRSLLSGHDSTSPRASSRSTSRVTFDGSQCRRAAKVRRDWGPSAGSSCQTADHSAGSGGSALTHPGPSMRRWIRYIIPSDTRVVTINR